MNILIKDRKLIWRLLKHDLQARYKGSLLGVLWAVITPLTMLMIFTFIFSVVFQIRWGVGIDDRSQFALMVFSGLIIYQVFAECAGRAPTLMMENISYIKKVVFPLETLVWVSVGASFFNFFISFFLLLLGQWIFNGTLHLTIAWLPFIIIPLAFFVTSFTLFISSLGVFLRDLKHVVGLLTTMMMFLSPIFYPISAVPEEYKTFIYFNPLSFLMDELRSIAILGNSPDFERLGLLTVVMIVAFIVTLFWFRKIKKSFADVV